LELEKTGIVMDYGLGVIPDNTAVDEKSSRQSTPLLTYIFIYAKISFHHIWFLSSKFSMMIFISMPVNKVSTGNTEDIKIN
jgi:hypothetical protein